MRRVSGLSQLCEELLLVFDSVVSRPRVVHWRRGCSPWLSCCPWPPCCSRRRYQSGRRRELVQVCPARGAFSGMTRHVPEVGSRDGTAEHQASVGSDRAAAHVVLLGSAP